MVTAFREHSPATYNPLSGTQYLAVFPVLEEIDSFQYLIEGWDGEDGLPVRKGIAEKATNLILYAYNTYNQPYIRHNFSWVEPEASPTGDGGIDLEWEEGKEHHRLLLSLNPNGSIGVLIRLGKKVILSKTLPANLSLNLQPLVELLDMWVFGRKTR